MEQAYQPDQISEWFWNIVANSRGSSDRLRGWMERATREDIIKFANQFYNATMELTVSPFIDNLGNISEDDIRDVAQWVVSQGKDYYISILQNPGSMPGDVPEQKLKDGLGGIADSVFWDRFGSSIPFEDE